MIETRQSVTIAAPIHATWALAKDVEHWAGPEQVDFGFRLLGDPVEGSGSYEAVTTLQEQTLVNLAVQVRGSGPMAPMWEAMGGPVLPKFAQRFAQELKARIEERAELRSPDPQPATLSQTARLQRWFKNLVTR